MTSIVPLPLSTSEAACPYFGICGGCQTLPQLSDSYLKWKHSLVMEKLAVPAILSQLEHPISFVTAGGSGRRRVTLHLRHTGKEIVVGFMKRHTHQLVPIEFCPILVPEFRSIVTIAKDIGRYLWQGHHSRSFTLDILATATRAGLDLDIRGLGTLTPKEHHTLASIAKTHQLARLSHHGTRVIEYYTPYIFVGDIPVELPIGAFIQATEEGERQLAQAVLKQATDKKRILDLFCGLGTFALRLARQAPVHAIDLSEGSLKSMIRAHRTLTETYPLSYEKRNLFCNPLSPQELKGYDLVICNPPRAGASRQMELLHKSLVPHILYVSCNMDSFISDARILSDRYRLTSLQAIDQFLFSRHIELFASFERL